MRKFLFVFVCMFSVSFFACSDDSTDDEDEDMMMNDPCEGTSFTFNSDIKSIVDNNCAISGCHDGGNSLPNFTTYQGVFAGRTGVKSRTSAMTMPPASSGRSLTDAQIEMIGCWVDSGAPE